MVMQSFYCDTTSGKFIMMMEIHHCDKIGNLDKNSFFDEMYYCDENESY